MDIPASSDPVKDDMTTPTPPDGGDLLPCPFCGSPARWAKSGSEYRVECTKIGVCHGCPPTEKTGCRYRDDAERLWNTRADQWQPIETAPRDGAEILVYRHDAGVFMAWFVSPAEILPAGGSDDYGSYWFSTTGEDLTNDMPTHWMPLPAPPRAAP